MIVFPRLKMKKIYNSFMAILLIVSCQSTNKLYTQTLHYKIKWDPVTAYYDLNINHFIGKVKNIKLLLKDKYITDSLGRLLVEERKYDSNENIIEIYEYDRVNKIPTEQAILQYNDDEATIRKKTFFNSQSYQKWKFDSKGNCIEQDMYDGSGKSEGKWINTYRDNKNIVATYYLNDTIYRKCSFDYDKFGNQIEAANFLPNGELINYFKWKYDNFGNVVEQLSYDSQNNLNPDETFDSQLYYDKFSNWIKEIRVNMKGDTSIFQREITY